MRWAVAWLLRIFGIYDEWECCESCGHLRIAERRGDRQAAALSDLLADKIGYDEYAERVI